MSSKAKKLLDEALQLAPSERENLAGQLFDRLDASDPEAESAWQAEIEKRIRDLDRGKVKPIQWAEARQLIFGDSDNVIRGASGAEPEASAKATRACCN